MNENLLAHTLSNADVLDDSIPRFEADTCTPFADQAQLELSSPRIERAVEVAS